MKFVTSPYVSKQKYETWIFDILKSKEGRKLGQVIKYYINRNFVEKYENVQKKSFPMFNYGK